MNVLMLMSQADILKRILYAEQNDSVKRVKHAHSHGESSYNEYEFSVVAQILGNIDAAITEEIERCDDAT